VDTLPTAGLLISIRNCSDDTGSFRVDLLFIPLIFFSFPLLLLLLFPTSEKLDSQPLPPFDSDNRLAKLNHRMSTLIKITPFNGGNTDQGESVDEYLDNLETAALSCDLTITSGIKEATDKFKIRLFRQNLERD